jgi:hypothetical protein
MTPTPPRKVVERMVLFEHPAGIVSVHVETGHYGVSSMRTDRRFTRIVAERLEEEPSEYELAARELDVAGSKCSNAGSSVITGKYHRELLEGAARLLRRADRESKGGKA